MTALIRVERFLGIYNRKGDDLVTEISLNVDIEALRKFIKPFNGDELFYRPLQLNKIQTKQLLKLINVDVIIEMKSYCYVLECTGVYK
ncbi:DUF7683 domain-containing protein [Mucilaginibacter phyllosphaerae]